MSAARPQVSTTLLVALVSLALTAVAAEAATPKEASALCRAVSQETSDNPGSSRLLGMDDPTASDESSPPIWQKRDRALMGVVVRRERSRYRLRVCTVAARELEGKTAKTVRQTGTTVTLNKRARPLQAAIANSWLTWVETSTPGRFVIRRQTLNGARRTSRSFRGEPRTIAMTRNGTVAVSTVTGRLQRIWRWPSKGSTTALTAPHDLNVTRAGTPKDPIAVQLWDPDSFLLTRPDQSERTRIATRDVSQVATERGGRACSVWTGRPLYGIATKTQLVRNTALTATLTNSNAWSLRARFSGEDWGYSSPSLTRLEACDPSSGNRVLAAPAGYDTDSYSVDEDGLGVIALVGDGIFATGGSSSGNTGSGATADSYDAAFVRDPRTPGAWMTSDRHVATPAAAAFVTDGQIWGIDAAGARPLRPTPTDFQGLRLSEARPVLSIVAVSQTEEIPLTAVRATEAVFPAGLPVSPTATTYPDGTKSATNFGICSDRTSTYCPDPLLPPNL